MRLILVDRLGLSTIGNLMLWPHDMKAREQAWQSQDMQFSRELLKMGLFSDELIREMANRAVDAPASIDIDDASKEPYVHGVIAGLILRNAVIPPATTLAEIINRVSKLFYPQ